MELGTQTSFDLSSLVDLPEHSLYARLQERRISAEVIAEFGIVPNHNGWLYPLPEGGYQWKNYNSNAEYKYFWCNETGRPAEKPASLWYYGSDLIPAIKDSGNTVWLVSGAPDLWAMYSAGIHHVISALGEYVPKDLAQRLQAAGVLVVYLAPDLDDTGRQFASQVEGALADAGLELDCRELPADLGPKGDLGRAWQQYNKGIPFERYLTGLQRWYPKPPEKVVKEYVQTSELGSVPQGYKDDICARLGVNEWGLDGWSKHNVKCPFHGDNHPSASVHLESGLWCFTDKHFYLWREIGQVLGIGGIHEWRLVNLQYTGLTTEIREFLVSQRCASLARLLDSLYASGLHANDNFTRDDACNLFHGLLSPDTVRTGINQLVSLFAPISLNSCLGSKRHNNSKRKGRKELMYKLPNIHELEQLLPADKKQGKHFDVIPIGKLGSAPDYKAEVHAALIRRKPNEYALSVLGKRLGISKNTVRSYNKRANIVTIPQEPKRDEMTPESIADLAEKVAKKRRGLQWIESPDGKKYPAEKGAAILALHRLAEDGQPLARLTLVTRKANRYEGGSA